MVYIHKKEDVASRPLFTDTETIHKKMPLFSDNPLLAQLRPSKPKAKITRVYEAFIHSLTQFFKISRPDSMKAKLSWIIRAGGSHLSGPATISFGNLWSHYSRFLKTHGKGTDQLTGCFTRLEQDERVIESLKMKEEKAASSPLNKKAAALIAVKKDYSQFVQKNLDEILTMKEGNSRLLLLEREKSTDGSLNGKLFCVVSKQDNAYSIRLTGTGSLMRELYPEEKALDLGGKEKVMRELCFDKVPQQALMEADWMKKFLEKWSEYEPITPKMIVESSSHLLPYKKETETLNDLTTCSDRVDHLFWNVIKTFPESPTQKNKIATQANRPTNLQDKHLKLRADVLTLFHLFQSLRYDLKPHTEDYQLLTSVFEGVAANAHLAHQKGYLAGEELNQLSAELAIIEQTLQDAKKNQSVISSTASFKKDILQGFSLKNLFIHPMELIKAKKTQEREPLLSLGHRTEGRQVSNEPLHIPDFPLIPLTLYGQITTKEAFLQVFREKFDKALEIGDSQHLAWQEMSRLITEVPFQPFEETLEKGQPAYKKNAQFWWNFSHEEAKEVMEKINRFSQQLVAVKRSPSISQYELESYLKLSQIVNFLNATVTDKWIHEWDVNYLIDLYKSPDLTQTRKRRDKGDYLDYHTRPGKPLQSSSSLQNNRKPLDFFFKKIGVSLWDNAKRERFVHQDKKTELLEEEYKYVKTQHDCLGTLLTPPEITQSEISHMTRGGPHSISREKKTQWFDNDQNVVNGDYFKLFFKTHSWDLWERPIHDPTLVALYQYAIIEPSTHVTPGKNLDTPEAFHDNPEKVFNRLLA